MKKTILAAVAALVPVVAEAGWTLDQRGGSAVMRQSVGGMQISFFCRGSARDQLQVSFSPWRQAAPRAVMLWIQAPDGRMARHSMDFTGQDSAASFRLLTSSLVLEQLRQATALEFTVEGKVIARTDARGTGAFRLAVKEQCRF